MSDDKGLVQKIDPVAQRFVRFINFSPHPQGCWLWTGATHRKGYGLFSFRGKKVLAHRAAMALFGEEPSLDGLVLHSCDNPQCVNPMHLRLGSYADNALDRAKRDRSRKSKQGFPRGVRRQHGSRRFVARASVPGENRQAYLGSFDSVELATDVVAAARATYSWETKP